jgi:hypothetical protein
MAGGSFFEKARREATRPDKFVPLSALPVLITNWLLTAGRTKMSGVAFSYIPKGMWRPPY